MISHKFKCIFVHIPKCGGSSIENVIWPEPRAESDLWMGFISKYHNKYQTGGLQHLFASHIRQEIGEAVFNSYYKFSIVRNPWDKSVSQYTYMGQRPDLREFIGMKENDSFKKYLQLIRKKNHVQWEKQYKFILNEKGDFMVNFLGRFENIKQDAQKIFNSLGIHTDLPHLNRTAHVHYSKYYDQESIDMIEDIYRDDIRLFGYSLIHQEPENVS